MSAAQLGTQLQTGTKTAAESLTRFVEGPSTGSGHARSASNVPEDKVDFWDSFGEPPKGPDHDKKDFWDEFAANSEIHQQTKAESSIGTSAMRKNAGSDTIKKDDSWGDW